MDALSGADPDGAADTGQRAGHAGEGNSAVGGLFAGIGCSVSTDFGAHGALPEVLQSLPVAHACAGGGERRVDDRVGCVARDWAIYSDLKLAVVPESFCFVVGGSGFEHGRISVLSKMWGRAESGRWPRAGEHSRNRNLRRLWNNVSIPGSCERCGCARTKLGRETQSDGVVCGSDRCRSNALLRRAYGPTLRTNAKPYPIVACTG